uniref:Uncharacterized protein n=1 Tax=Lactuca sativa TaxID=4236 RepID=A0A9R1XD21_LACSA|nr:hypothetical protein LSAT_V11C500235720 [Lactuca sativa]
MVPQTTETRPTRQTSTSSADPLQPHTYSLFLTVLGMHRKRQPGFCEVHEVRTTTTFPQKQSTIFEARNSRIVLVNFIGFTTKS